jgi:hypothetical protein
LHLTEEITGGQLLIQATDWLDNLYSSSALDRVVKPRMVRSARHTKHMREMINAYKNLVGKPEERRPHSTLLLNGNVTSIRHTFLIPDLLDIIVWSTITALSSIT